MANDDTTDKLFPHQLRSVSGEVERPIPLQPSIRAEFAQHRLEIDTQLRAFRLELGEALARLSPVPTVGGALRRGALTAGKLGPVVLAVLGLLEVVVPLVKPEWIGPLKGLREMLGANQ
jgi:hypothetical protein